MDPWGRVGATEDNLEEGKYGIESMLRDIGVHVPTVVEVVENEDPKHD